MTIFTLNDQTVIQTTVFFELRIPVLNRNFRISNRVRLRMRFKIAIAVIAGNLMINGYIVILKRIGHIPITQIVFTAFVIKERAVFFAEIFIKGGEVKNLIRLSARAKKQSAKA